MKHLYSILAATLFAGAADAATFSVDFFHDSLEPHGDWREVGDYGYCWQPRDVERDWRPYRDGRWIYTDAGWTWDSDEPYSWAVYHYGRWARVDRVGWVWVPGTEWGPAWVSWRRSERHVGWAPLPPEATFTRSVGFSARVDVDYDIGPTNYSFVNTRDFGSRRLSRVIIAPTQNVTIINRTTNITNITYVNNTVINNGPQYETISRLSSEPIRRMTLDRRVDFDGDPRAMRSEQLRTVVKGDSLQIAAPNFDAKPASAPRKVVAKVEKAEINRGWKDAGSTAEVEKLRTKIKEEPARPDAEPTPPPQKETSPTAKPIADEKPAKENPLKPGEPKAEPTAPPHKDVTPTPKPAPNEKPAKEKPMKGDEPKVEPTPPPQKDVTPTPKPAPNEKPPKGKPMKGDEPKVEPTPAKPQPVPPEQPAAPTKSKAPDAPLRPETAQPEKVQPGKGEPPRQVEPTPPRKIERETPKLPDPKPVLKEPNMRKSLPQKPAINEPEAKEPDARKPVPQKPVPQKPVPQKPVAKEPDAKKPAAREPQPAAPPTEPVKGKGKKKGKDGDETTDEKPKI